MYNSFATVKQQKLEKKSKLINPLLKIDICFITFNKQVRIPYEI